MYVFGSVRCRMIGGEWMRGFGFTNAVGTWEVFDVCLCLGCCGVGVFMGSR